MNSWRKNKRLTCSDGSVWAKGGSAIFFQEVCRLIFPPRCPVCDRILGVKEIRKGSLIHGNCKTLLMPVVQPFCFHCGRPVAGLGTEYCYDCKRRLEKTKSPYWRRNNPASWFVQGRALYVYQGPVRRTMYRLKYSNRREYAEFFAKEAAARYGKWIRRAGVETIVPIPVYWKKQKKRGYNQAGLLAEQIAELLGLAYEPEALIRVRNTKPQKELGEKERKNNLKSAFQAADFVVKYNCILLIDDIYTTGATVESAARTLRESGVKEVYVLTACIGMGAMQEV